jgi:uncharacterized protein (TIGR03437 family)
MRSRFTGALAGLLLILSPAAWGYIRTSFAYSNGTNVFMKRADATAAGVQFSINNQVLAAAVSSASGSKVTVISSASDPVSAIRAAAATWNRVSTSAARFLPLKSTASTINSGDGQNTIAIGVTAGDLSVVGGAVAVTAAVSAPFNAGSQPSGDVSDTDIILNPAFAFSTDGSTTIDLQAVMTHEFGHSLGLSHSGLLGATMFQYTSVNQRFLSSDEAAFATAIYPASGSSLGTVSGKVVASDGTAVQSALVEMIDVTNGYNATALTAEDGTYSTQVPGGSYVVYAEPLTGIVQAGNLYLSLFTPVTTNFQVSALGGLSAPTKVSVAGSGSTAIPNLMVTSGSSSLSTPFVGIGKAGGSRDIGSVLSSNPFVVASGQSVDIGLTGGGVDNTVTIQAIGAGISVRTGSVHADPGVTFGGQPLIRATLDITGRQSPTVATIAITKGSSTLALSGLLVVVPPTPTFTSAAVASSTGAPIGSVSPGGIYSVYDFTNSSLGPATGLLPSGYDPYGNLGTILGNVTVSFNGVPAPLFYAGSTQVNFQVPFEVAGKSTASMVVTNYGSPSAAVSVPVMAAQPAFFTYNSSAIAQNYPDYSLNTSSNAIARGGIAVLYGTGLGALSYSLGTGAQGIVPPSSYSSTYSCSFGGQKASAYAYWYYGFVGLATWTVTVPANAPTGSVALTCTDSITGAVTPASTIYVK